MRKKRKRSQSGAMSPVPYFGTKSSFHLEITCSGAFAASFDRNVDQFGDSDHRNTSVQHDAKLRFYIKLPVKKKLAIDSMNRNKFELTQRPC